MVATCRLARQAASRAASTANPDDADMSGDSSGSDFEPPAGASASEDEASIMDLTPEDDEHDLQDELQGLVSMRPLMTLFADAD